MRRADLHIGHDYALPGSDALHGPQFAAKVRVESLDGGGMVTVRVLDPLPQPVRAGGAQRLRRGGKSQVTARSIACPWEQWAARAAELEAKREARAASFQSAHEQSARARADRVTVDPNRPLPDAYDEDRYGDLYDPEEDAAERDALAEAYIKVRRLGSYASPEEIRAMLGDLPVPVVRDILAAEPRTYPGVDASAGATFVRAAELLEIARRGMLRSASGYGACRPAEVLTAEDAAFVHAVQRHVAAQGAELILPPVPDLPEWVGDEVREIAAVLGWLRVAVAKSGGEKLHAAGCRSAHATPILTCAHRSWWQVLLEGGRLNCGRCGGPGLRDLTALAGFVAAVDVWRARGRDRIEDWQQEALQRLVAVTAAARVLVREPDITLAHRVVAALAPDPPGQEGWDAYGLGAAEWWHRPAMAARELTSGEREAARVLLRDRIAVLESVLPATGPGRAPSVDVDIEELRARYAQLKARLGPHVPQLDRLMFTLPNAIWGV